MKAVEITDIYLQSFADKNTNKKIQYKVNAPYPVPFLSFEKLR